jgi:hypothetical protein
MEIIYVILILIILYWFFNLQDNVLSIDLPVENMSNISIFDGNNIHSHNI